MSQAKLRDEIDMILDDLLARPDRAEELKRKLRDTLETTGFRRTRHAHLKVVTDSVNDPDSLWDNMPV